MAVVGYHASHEQFCPSDLLRWAIMAEQAGFGAINCSDHFHPWSEAQGQSGFSFAWLGAAMQATRISFGTVCAPGQRYHPAIVAQAAATLSEMFPQRFWLSLGSGEALNESITGDSWPIKSDRNGRLLECAEIIKRLFKGKTVTHTGRVKVQEARLYTLPEHLPLLLGAAVSKETAAWMGGWADGLITMHRPLKKLREVLNAFRNNGGDDRPVYLKVQISYHRSEELALEGAYEQWRTNILPQEILDDLWLPRQYDAASKFVRPEDLKSFVHISSKPKDFIDIIQAYIDMGFEKVLLHNVNKEQESFIHDFGKKVLPFLKTENQIAHAKTIERAY